MSKYVEVTNVIVVSAEAQITLLIEPNSQRVPRRDENPLANVEFPTPNDKRMLDVLLNDPLFSTVRSLGVRQELVQIIEEGNPTTTTLAAGLDDPDIRA
jgi:hypothetical protein